MVLQERLGQKAQEDPEANQGLKALRVYLGPKGIKVQKVLRG